MNITILLNKRIHLPGEKKRQKFQQQHEKLTAPPFVHHFDGKKWDVSAVGQVPKIHLQSADCMKLIKIYCSCNVGHWMCVLIALFNIVLNSVTWKNRTQHLVRSVAKALKTVHL
jgi:hypothetical protein